MKAFPSLSIAAGAFVLASMAGQAHATPGSTAGPSGTQDAMDHGVAGTAPPSSANKPVPASKSQADDPTKPVKLQARLNGQSETGKGDADALGVFAGRLNRSEGQLCYSMKVTKLKAPTAAKIHAGPAGSAGDVALTLEAPANGESTGCVDVAREVADAMVTSPENFYVNVQNSEYQNGAIRGQLSEG